MSSNVFPLYNSSIYYIPTNKLTIPHSRRMLPVDILRRWEACISGTSVRRSTNVAAPEPDQSSAGEHCGHADQLDQRGNGQLSSR